MADQKFRAREGKKVVYLILNRKVWHNGKCLSSKRRDMLNIYSKLIHFINKYQAADVFFCVSTSKISRNLSERDLQNALKNDD